MNYKIITVISLITILSTASMVSSLILDRDSDVGKDKFQFNPPSTDQYPKFRGDPANTGNVSATGPTDEKPSWTNNNGGYCSPVIKYDQLYYCSSRTVFCFDLDGNQIWTYASGEIHWNTPLVIGGRIYVAGDSGNLLCLNANATGSGTTTRYWTFTPSDTVDGCTSSPTTDGKRIFYNIETPGDGMIAVWISNGTEAWTSSLDGSLDIESSPAYWNGRVYTGAGNSYRRGSDYMYCFNSTNGSLIWKFDAGDPVCSTPAVEYGRVYFGGTDSKVYCIDAIGSGSSTTLYWTHTLTVKAAGIASSPAVAYGRVFIGDEDRRCYLYSLDAFGSGSSTTVYWKVSLASNGIYGICSSPVVTSGFVYVGTTENSFHCRNITDGSLQWSRTFPNGTYGISSSPAVIDDIVAFSSDDGYIYVFEQKVDYTLPKIRDHHPLDGSRDVPLDTNISVEFNESMDPSSLTETSVTLEESGGPLLNISIEYNEISNTMKINPEAPLEKSMTYVIELDTSITDPSENPLDGNGNGMFDGPSDLFSFEFTTIGYSRPVISLTWIRALEEYQKIIHLSDFISDDDTPFSELDLSENSSYAEIEDGDLILYYPEGVTGDVINLTVSDGHNIVHQDIIIEVDGENDPPTIDPLGTINPVEDEDFILDLTGKVHDPDRDILTITTSSPYAVVDGLFVTFNYPDGVKDEEVVVSVSDGIEGIWTILMVSVVPVNDPPVILDVNDLPPPFVDISTPEDTLLRIHINYTDIDGPQSDIIIDDQPVRMDFDYTSSSIIYSPIQEDVGLHILNFTVKDGRDGRMRDTVQINITVTNVNDPPVPSPIELIEGGSLNLTVHLQTTPASDEDGDQLRYIWDFGDEHTQIGGMDVFHTYAQEGNYTVSLEVKDSLVSVKTRVDLRITAPIKESVDEPVDEPDDDELPDENETEDPDPNDNTTIEPEDNGSEMLFPILLGSILALILILVIGVFAVILYRKRDPGYEKGEDKGMDLSERGEIWEEEV